MKQPVDGLVLSNGIRPGIAGLFKTLAGDLAKDGITVNLVLPGRIRTDRSSTIRRIGPSAGAHDGGADRAVHRRHPDGRIGTPEEFAAMVVFLASARASYITGTAVQVDGGLVRQRRVGASS